MDELGGGLKGLPLSWRIWGRPRCYREALPEQLQIASNSGTTPALDVSHSRPGAPCFVR